MIACVRLLMPLIWIIAAMHVTGVSCVIPPKNTAVVQGSNVTFSCSSDKDNVIRWDYYPHGSTQPRTVYNGQRVADNIDKRISVDIDGCRSRTCNLSVVNVRLGDAGYFVCFEAAKTTKYMASLTVLGSTTECSTNLTLRGHSLLVDDYLKIDCRVDVNGSWTPSVECSPSHGSPINASEHGSVFTSSMTIAARLLDPGAVFTCTTSFNGSRLPNSTVQHASLSTNVPDYRHQWHSKPVQVQGLAQSTSRTISQATVGPPSDVSSTKSPPPPDNSPVSATPIPEPQPVSTPADTVTATSTTVAEAQQIILTLPTDKVLIIGLSLVGLLLLAIFVIVILVVVVISKRRRTNRDTVQMRHPLPSPWYGSPAVRGQSLASEPTSHYSLVAEMHPIDTRPLFNNSCSSPTQLSNSDYGNDFFVRATNISNPNYEREYIPDPTVIRSRAAPPGYAADNGAMLPMYEEVAQNVKQLQQQTASEPTDDYLAPSIRVGANTMQVMGRADRPTQMQ